MNKISRILASLPILAMVTGSAEGVSAKDYNLNVVAEKREEKIVVSGKTNLPDGCVLGVFIERPHWERGDETTYTGHMGFGEATVENGSYEVSLTPDDEGWYDNAIMLIELGLWTDFERISDDVKISVIFTPKRDQPESVYAIVGNNAENLTGEEVEVSGHFKVLKAETTLNMYFIPPKTPMPITTSTPTPIQGISKPEPIKLSGRDSSLTSIFPLERGASIFRLKNEVPSNFKVLLVRKLYECRVMGHLSLLHRRCSRG